MRGAPDHMAGSISGLKLVGHVVDAVIVVSVDEKGAFGAKGLQRLAHFGLVGVLTNSKISVEKIPNCMLTGPSSNVRANWPGLRQVVITDCDERGNRSCSAKGIAKQAGTMTEETRSAAKDFMLSS